jgi:alkylresorcinol/alkylpyrone synthase
MTAVLRELWGHELRMSAHPNLLEQLHRNTAVLGRHLALPIAEYAAHDTFTKRNDAWIRVATDLGEQATRAALEAAGLEPRDIDQVVFVTVTGVATPSVDAKLMNRLGLRPDVKRTPIFGLGCVAGAAGLARAADSLRAFEDDVVLLLSVELCSLTLQLEDCSVANMIATGLFGDGASAVLLGGARRATRGPRVIASRSIFYPDTEDAMGWEVSARGFKVILRGEVPELARAHAGPDVTSFLAAHELDRSRIRHWVCHTGGPKVLEAMAESLELPRSALERSWRSLAANGNLSSASVLLVLGDLLASGEAREGDLGLLMAMGPGFCSELVLLAW